MGGTVTVEYRVPVPVEQDEQVQELARRLARERGQRRVPIRQIVREALASFLFQHRIGADGSDRDAR